MPHADVLTLRDVTLGNADIVEIKHIMLPPSPREFKDIYVVFELMETDLHQVPRQLHKHHMLICSSGCTG